MSNTEPVVIPPGEPVVEGNTISFEICGNPNVVERIHVHAEDDGVQTYTYGYIDPNTNTFFHSHSMERKAGKFL